MEIYDGNEQKRKNIINRADSEDLFYDGKSLKLRTVTKMKEGDEIMFDLVKRISQRAQYLDEMIIRVRRKVDAAPENRLRIDASGTKPRYCEVDKEDTIVRYLSEKDMAQVEALAQKSYDKKVLSAACRERDVLEKLADQGELMSYTHKGFWQCMDSAREKVILETMIENGKAPWIHKEQP